MKKKILTLCVVVALAAAAVIGGSLAYFTDTTDTKENVINIGKVDIDLEEPNYEGNDQTLVPGTTITKDPTVTVADDSEDAYLFVEIDWNRYKAFISTAINAGVITSVNDLATSTGREAFVNFFIDGLDHSKWTVMNAAELMNFDQSQDYLPIILGYNNVVKAGDSIPVFTGIKFDASLTQEDMRLFYEYLDGTPKTGDNQVKINITATAVQKENVATLAAAYAIAFPQA